MDHWVCVPSKPEKGLVSWVMMQIFIIRLTDVSAVEIITPVLLGGM